MKPPPFEYKKVDSAAEAASLLKELGTDARILAGGQSLIPLMNLRLASPACLVDISGVDELDYILLRNGNLNASSLSIGAAATQRDVELHAEVLRIAPVLAEAISNSGMVPVRHRGTVVGSVAHADPSAEIPAAFLAQGGSVEAVSAERAREIPAEDFFEGVFTTALREGELVSAIRVKEWPAGSGHGFQELRRRCRELASRHRFCPSSHSRRCGRSNLGGARRGGKHALAPRSSRRRAQKLRAEHRSHRRSSRSSRNRHRTAIGHLRFRKLPPESSQSPGPTGFNPRRQPRRRYTVSPSKHGISLNVNGKTATAEVESRLFLGRFSAPRPGFSRRPPRVRARSLRRLHRACKRAKRAFLPHVGGASRRLRGAHGRKPRAWRRTAPATGSLPQTSSPAVRLLHAGDAYALLRAHRRKS